MTYAIDELRAGIVDMFDDAVRMSPYTVAYEEFSAMSIFVRAQRPRRDPEERRPKGLGAIEARTRATATLIRKGQCACVRCGSRSPTHRCPVVDAALPLPQFRVRQLAPMKQWPRRDYARIGATRIQNGFCSCMRCGSNAPEHRCPVSSLSERVA